MAITITEKQITAWQWHTAEEINGILEDTAANLNLANYKRKIHTFQVAIEAGFADQALAHLPTLIRGIGDMERELGLTSSNPAAAAEVRATTINALFSHFKALLTFESVLL